MHILIGTWYNEALICGIVKRNASSTVFSGTYQVEGRVHTENPGTKNPTRSVRFSCAGPLSHKYRNDTAGQFLNAP